jgi:hypothetical protein
MLLILLNSTHGISHNANLICLPFSAASEDTSLGYFDDFTFTVVFAFYRRFHAVKLLFGESGNAFVEY